MFFSLRSFVLTVFAVAVAIPAVASDKPGSVTIHRDEWGVPYIFAATDDDAAYGLGYAMAEDRLADLYTNVRTATGRMAEAFGPDHVEMDYIIRMARIPDRCEEYWTTAPQHLQNQAAAFVRGVEAYVKENPDKDPEHALDLEPWHVGAIGQAMISRWPLGQIQDELERTQNSTGFGSNQWSVAPTRSADGRAILLTDPHLTWEGLAVFYEAHVFGDALEMHGYFLVGSPLLAFGHNGYVGWAPTTGGPDTADVYELELNPDNQGQYKYDGEWKRTRVAFIQIPVKGAKPVMRPAAYSHLGPYVSEPKDGKAYVGASPYLNEIGIPAQFWDMVAAKDADEFYEALGQNHYMEQNIMYADRAGTIGYVRVGRVPVRPEGYNWLEAVPGNSSATAWDGIHPIEDLVQIKNPDAGFMQNCNISPANMMPNSPLQPDKYRDYIYNVSWDSQNTRGLRALEALGADDSLTVAEAKAVAFDVQDVLAPAWDKALRAALENYGDEYDDPEFQKAAQTILDWDHQFTKDSRAAALVFYWRDYAEKGLDLNALVNGEELDEANQRRVLDGLRDALAEMERLYGDKAVSWGDIHKIGRGGKHFPVGGAVLGNGRTETRTLFNVGAREEEKGSGVYVANNGSMAMALMFFSEDRIEAYTCIPWGQSAHPDSPHFMDQGEKLYSQREFKRAWSTKEELEPHINSTKTLKTT